jgi:hypothetical protein
MTMVVVAVVPVMIMVVMPMPSGGPEALLHPAPAIPDRTADVAHVLDKAGSSRGAKLTRSRQGDGFGAACGK